MLRIFKKHSKKLLVAFGVFIALIYFTLLKIPPSIEVNFLNIGQGDATLIVTPQLKTVLIDGGPGETVLEEIGEVLPFFVRDIDFIILTHPHRDHVEGLIEVLKRYKVRHLLIAGDAYGSSLYGEFLKTAREKEVANGLQIHFVSAESDFKIETKDGDLVFDILHPIDTIAGKVYENTNNASVVMRMSFSEKNAAVSSHVTSFLFTGDCEIECEEEILHHYGRIDLETGRNSLNLLDSDVLKIGHHGSRTSTSPAFLGAVSPNIAVIQSGIDNQFEHPHPETLEKLQKAKIKIHRNDLEGRITIPIFMHP